MPPATTTELFSVCTACAARATAFNPEPHTLLIVMAPTSGASPPKIAAWRAGFCPSPAATTLPMMHSSTRAGSMPARRTASRTTIAPSCGAEKSFSDPRNLPVGVRTAETMTDSRIDVETLHGVVAEQHLHARQNRAAGALQLARPSRIARGDNQVAVA